MADYVRAVALVHGPDNEWFHRVAKQIQEHFIGPDCYWKDPETPSIPGCTRFFGNAWWIPFPPTVVSALTIANLNVLRMMCCR